jgi:hypothetical protein
MGGRGASTNRGRSASLRDEGAGSGALGSAPALVVEIARGLSYFLMQPEAVGDCEAGSGCPAARRSSEGEGIPFRY